MFIFILKANENLNIQEEYLLYKQKQVQKNK